MNPQYDFQYVWNYRTHFGIASRIIKQGNIDEIFQLETAHLDFEQISKVKRGIAYLLQNKHA